MNENRNDERARPPADSMFMLLRAGAKKVEAVQAEFESTLGTDRAALSRVLASFV